MMFIFNLLCKNVQQRKAGNLSAEEVREAKLLWIQVMQRELYDDNKQIKWLKKNLGIYTNEQNILRCKGRFENTLLTFNERNPILLPKNGHLQLILIRKAHEKTEHGNIKDTLAELRTKYWLINSGKMVTNYVSKCKLCERLDCEPFKSQEASQLPSFRVSQSYPFTNTGVDYAGPYLVRQIFDNETNSKMFNAHIVLYTCAATRAVHLDLVPDPGASSFIRSLKRFIGRRGIPNLMISDNATCFKNEEVKLSE